MQWERGQTGMFLDTILAENLKKVYKPIGQKSQKGANTVIMKRWIY
jgi:hypothetical protein